MIVKGLNALTVTLSANTNADVFASWRDLGYGEAAASHNTKVSGTSAVIVVGAPGSGRLFRITDLQITLPYSTSAGCHVTVGQSDGTISWEVTSADLVNGDSLLYHQQLGWRVRALALDGNAVAQMYRDIYPNVLI